MSPRRNWNSPNPSLNSEFAPTPGTKGEVINSPAGEGLGESQFRRLEKSLALCILSVCTWRRHKLSSVYYDPHKVLIYIEHHSVCPLVGIWTPPTPLPQASVPPPPQDQRVGGGAHSPAARGWGSSNSDDWRKSLALCLLCAPTLPGGAVDTGEKRHCSV